MNVAPRRPAPALRINCRLSDLGNGKKRCYRPAEHDHSDDPAFSRSLWDRVEGPIFAALIIAVLAVFAAANILLVWQRTCGMGAVCR